MNLNTWDYYCKINPEKLTPSISNMIYTPMIKDDTFCMWFDHTNTYQDPHLRPLFTKELVKFFFDREVKYLTAFKERAWAPTVLDINESTQQIFFKWSGETCNNIIYSGRNLNDYCSNWEEQLYVILKDIVDSGYYKVSLYQHCFFIENGILKTFDFYGCAETSNPFVEIKTIQGMIGTQSGPRFETATQGGKLNIKIFFKEALEKHIRWPNNALNTIYRKIYD